MPVIPPVGRRSLRKQSLKHLCKIFRRQIKDWEYQSPSNGRWQTCAICDSSWTSWRQTGGQSRAAAIQPATTDEEEQQALTHSSSTTFRQRDNDVWVTWAVASMKEIRNVSVQLVPQTQMMSQARASSSRMWPRWRQKNKGRAWNKPSLSACTRKVWKSCMIVAWEQRRRDTSANFELAERNVGSHSSWGCAASGV